jgi:GT2 family glycosyltransferase
MGSIELSFEVAHAVTLNLAATGDVKVLRFEDESQVMIEASPSRPARVATRVIDVLLVSFNSAHLIDPLRETLEQAEREGFSLRVLAVDNASTDGSGEKVRTTLRCEVFIQNEDNVGFGRANNQLLEHVRSEYVLLLNTDAFMSPGTIGKSLAYMDAHPRCGILGVRLTDADGTLQPSRRSFPTPLNAFLRRTGLQRLLPVPGARLDSEQDHTQEGDCDWVPGCYYLVRRAVLDEVGLFDPRFFLYCEEVDHCRRTRNAGWSVAYLPSTSVVHLGGESAKSVASLTHERQISVLQTESDLLYTRKHFGMAGLWLHLGLVLLGDFLLACKDLLKGRAASAWRQFQCSRITFQLAGRTRLGSQPTR